MLQNSYFYNCDLFPYQQKLTYSHTSTNIDKEKHCSRKLYSLNSTRQCGINCSALGCGSGRRMKGIGIFQIPDPKVHKDWRKRWLSEITNAFGQCLTTTLCNPKITFGYGGVIHENFTCPKYTQETYFENFIFLFFGPTISYTAYFNI